MKGRVKTSSGFIGFGTDLVVSNDVQLDPEIEKLFKALSKKDSVTKIKALKSIGDLKDLPKEQLELVLSTWASHFPGISEDVDWKVRLEVFQTWAKVIEKVGKGPGLQKELKSCLGSWVIHFYDPVAEVSTAARAAFPIAKDKYRAALGAFKDDLFKALRRNFMATPQSLSEGKSFVSEQDAEAIWENVVSSSILFSIHLVTELGAGAEELLLDKSVLSLMKSVKSPLVRRSLLSVVSHLCSFHSGALVESTLDVTLQLTIAGFEESEVRGVETLVAYLTNVPAAWKRVKNLWPKLFKWLPGARAPDCAYVLGLIAAAKDPAMLGQSVAKFTEGLFAAFWKAAVAKKVRTVAAEVLSHMLDCLVLLLTRFKDDSVVRVIAPRFVVDAVSGKDFPCHLNQLVESSGFIGFFGKVGVEEAFWQSFEAILKDEADLSAVAAGLTVILQGSSAEVVKASNHASSFVASKCKDAKALLQLNLVAQKDAVDDFWSVSLAAIEANAETGSRLALAFVKKGDIASQVPQLVELCTKSAPFLLAVLSDNVVVEKVRSSIFDEMILLNADVNALAKACEVRALTDEGLVQVAKQAKKWPQAGAVVVQKYANLLSADVLSQASAAAVYAGKLKPSAAVQAGVSSKDLVEACGALCRSNSDVQVSASVALSLVEAFNDVALAAWPWVGAPSLQQADSNIGLASLMDDNVPVKHEIPAEDVLFRASVILQAFVQDLPGHVLASNSVLEKALCESLLVGVCCGCGRSEEDEDNSGFQPRLSLALWKTFSSLQSSKAAVLAKYPGLQGVCKSASNLLSELLLQMFFGVERTRAKVFLGLDTPAAAMKEVVLLTSYPFKSWTDVDRVEAACRFLVDVSSRLEWSPDKEQRGVLAGLVSHRCWQVQWASATILSRAIVDDDSDLLDVAKDTLQDPWSRMLVWWSLLSRLSTSEGLQRKGIVAAALAGAPFASFAEDTFGFIVAATESEAYAGCENPMDVRNLVPQRAADRGRLAAHLWYSAVQHLRTLARKWFSELQDKQLLALVTAFSTKYVCPIIMQNEVKACKSTDAMSIKTTSRSVVASVEKDDVAVELTIALPKLFPLQPVEVTASKGNLPEALLRRWVLSMTILTLSSEGSLAQACGEWGKNAAQYFEGVESCHICFCVLSEQGVLPKLRCANCNCAFHPECIAKWFSTSHVSKCCMCQLPWQSKR